MRSKRARYIVIAVVAFVAVAALACGGTSQTATAVPTAADTPAAAVPTSPAPEPAATASQ